MLHELPPEKKYMGQIPHIVRFATFELRKDTRELSNHGVRIRLQTKPFQVLETLVNRPGELTTREELREKLWPSGTFVDFESGLNTAINRLRCALGDSAEEPRYIETLPRLGYRFICPLAEMAEDHEPLAERFASELTQAHPLPPPNSPPHGLPLPEKSKRNPTPAISFVIGSIMAIALISVGFLLRRSSRGPADFRPVSLRGGLILSARFLPGSRVIYSTRRNDAEQIFVANLDGTDSYVLPVRGLVVAAAGSGDLAIVSRDFSKRDTPVQLVRSSVVDGKTVLLAQHVMDADWMPDGKRLAVVRQIGSETNIEFPLGKTIFHSQSWIDCVRVSPNGAEVAFWEHPMRDDDAGRVRVISAEGVTKVLTQEWSSGEGLAWSPSGREIWFTASSGSQNRSLYAVSRFRRARKISNQAASLRLLDVASDGRVLLAIDDTRMILRTALCGKETDISQFDTSHVDDMTQDGTKLLFTEGGDFGGQHYGAYIYDRTSGEARRFASGRALALSADGKRAVTVDPQDRTALTITSLPSGDKERVPGLGFHYQWARFSKPGHLVVGGAYPGQPLITADQNIGTGQIAPLAGAPYFENAVISPDGMSIAGRVSDVVEVFDVKTSAVQRLLPELNAIPVAWSTNGKRIYLLAFANSSYPILECNLTNGQSAPWKTIEPPDALDFSGLAGVAVAPDSGAYAYSANVGLSRLYVVDGLT